MTNLEKIDAMIDEYQRLDSEAHDMFDHYCRELQRARYAQVRKPYMSVGAIKQREFAEAGSTWNVVEMLRILKRRHNACAV